MNIHLYIRILLFIAFQLSVLILSAQTEIVWIKNIGGSSNDIITSICSDGDNGAIINGHFNSTNAPFGGNSGKFDAFIQAVDAQGNTSWTQNLGTSQNELAGPLLFNRNNVINSAIHYNSKEDNNNINLSQFDFTGNLVSESTLDFKGLAFPRKLAKSNSGGFFVAGNSSASDARYGGWDVFVYKLNEQGSIQWKKYFGGEKYDAVESIVELEDGRILLTGFTYSARGFDVVSFGKKDAWAMLLENDGTTIWSKVFGTDGYEQINSAALDRNGNVILCGTQGLFDFSNSVQGGVYQDQIWVMSIDAQGRINWERQYGGSDDESVSNMVKDASGNFVILANTKSNDGIAAQNRGKQDALVLNISPSGDLRWSSTYGAEGKDEANDLFVDGQGAIWIVGQSDSQTGDFSQNRGLKDAWMFKIRGEAPTFTANLGPDVELCLGQRVNVNATIPSCDCSYLWSDGSTAPELELMPASDVTYQITITDADGNQAFDAINIKVNASPEATLIPTDPRCFEEANGAIEVFIEQGSSNLFFNWNNGQQEQNLNGLVAGEYELTITDEIGCSATFSTRLDQPINLDYNVSTESITCTDAQNGSIDFNLVGGVGPYDYLWNTGAITNQINNLPAGFYQVTATDANNCQIEYSTQLLDPNPITIIENITSVECSDNPSGSIDLEIVGGVEPYEYIWSNGSSDSNIDELGSGTYSITVIDNNNCEQSASYEIETSESIQVESTTSDVTCNGLNNGSISLQAQNNSEIYNYLWNTGSEASSLENLEPGNYNVTVSTAAGCEVIESFEILEPRAIDLNSNVQALKCFDSNDASISLEVGGGTGALNISWEDGSTSLERINLEAGTYAVEIMDENGCTLEQSFIIEPVEAIEINAEVIQNECLEITAGEIILNVSGGSGTLETIWNNEGEGLVQNELEAGIYSVTVIDENECQAEASFEIFQSFELKVSETMEAISCNGGNDGRIAIDTDSNEELIYAWSNGADGSEITALEAGGYMLTISNANNCERIFEFEISEPEPLDVVAALTNVDCHEEETGAAEFTIEGGVEPYEIILIDNDDNSVAVGNSISDLPAGNYKIEVKDFNGCTFELDFEIDEGVQLLAEFDIQEINCPGEFASIQANLDIIDDELEFEWSNGVTGPVNDNLLGGSYFVSITNEAECMVIYQIFINEPDPFDLGFALDNEKCFEENNGEIAVSFSGGTSPYTFEWSNGETDLILENLAPDTYDLNVLDANGCAFDTSFIVEPAEEIQVQVNVQDPNEGANNGSIELEIEGETGPYVVSWSNGQEDVLLENLGPGEYTYTIVDFFGCIKEGTLVLIELEPLSTLEIISGIKVFPNPASNKVNLISDNFNQDLELAIINGIGQIIDVEIVKTSRRNVTVDVSKLNPGIYFVEGLTSDGRILEKIIVQRID